MSSRNGGHGIWLTVSRATSSRATSPHVRRRHRGDRQRHRWNAVDGGGNTIENGPGAGNLASGNTNRISIFGVDSSTTGNVAGQHRGTNASGTAQIGNAHERWQASALNAINTTVTGNLSSGTEQAYGSMVPSAPGTR
jgi:hypothetical protein